MTKQQMKILEDKIIDLYGDSGLTSDEILVSLERLLSTGREALKGLDNEKPTLLESALNGTLEMNIAAETVRRLNIKCKAEGKDTFSMADIRQVKRDIYEGKK